MERTQDAYAIVVFGAGGDLTKRKLIPALYYLAAQGYLAKDYAVVGVDRAAVSTDDFRRQISEALRHFVDHPVDPGIWYDLTQRLYYVEGDLMDARTYERLRLQLDHVDAVHGTRGNYLFYLATVPSLFAEIGQRLCAHALTTQRDGHWRRVVIEKPFGRDLDSARELNRQLLQVLAEDQMYRIDHYLGKETVQNILAFRFANSMFEPIWNHHFIDHVQVTVAETIGIEHRGRYYEEAGALRDMVPSHLLQLVALIAMEPPNSLDADAVRDEKTKLLRAVLPLNPINVLRNTVFGQYDAGAVDGRLVPAYRAEPDVSPTSGTETYVAMKLTIDTWRWANVPFYLRTGKRLARRVTEIVIQFKSPPLMLFRKTPVEQLPSNMLVIRIQPDEGISLRFDAKVPGPTLRLGTVDMDFQYAKYFGDRPQTGYETLLHDCLAGDATLFQRADNIEAGWSVVQGILDVWQSLKPASYPNYAAGSEGPKEADDLLASDGRQWNRMA